MNETKNANIKLVREAIKIGESSLAILDELLKTRHGLATLRETMPYSADHVAFDVQQLCCRLQEASNAMGAEQ